MDKNYLYEKNLITFKCIFILVQYNKNNDHSCYYQEHTTDVLKFKMVVAS